MCSPQFYFVTMICFLSIMTLEDRYFAVSYRDDIWRTTRSFQQHIGGPYNTCNNNKPNTQTGKISHTSSILPRYIIIFFNLSLTFNKGNSFEFWFKDNIRIRLHIVCFVYLLSFVYEKLSI